MTLEQWLKNGWLKKHTTSPTEIRNLLAIVERDLKDANLKELSADGRMGAAYSAGLQLCEIMLRASGYRAGRGEGQHFRTIASLVEILGPKIQYMADMLNTFRTKRNLIQYEQAGVATDADIEELLNLVGDLKVAVRGWLKKNHPELLGC